MTRTLWRVVVGRTVAIATVAPALVLARRPADEIKDPTRLHQREHEQQDARDTHGSVDTTFSLRSCTASGSLPDRH
jgi:hypothetical protein